MKKAEVSFKEKKAVVYYDAGKASVDQMIQAVQRVGFRAFEKKP